MRDQFDKFGRIEYVAVATTRARPRRPWRSSLAYRDDDFVEPIPFKNKRICPGVIRIGADRPLYDDSGNFRRMSDESFPWRHRFEQPGADGGRVPE